ncbi:MAG: DUF4212 domain-containing protein [bacterium]|jgi:putative solute:sodium symporter small subunit
MSNRDSSSKDHASYWQKVRALTFALLLAWTLLNFCVIFFARELAGLMLFGWPVPFYMAAQGSILIYLLIIGIYARTVNQLERALDNRDIVKASNESD